MDEHESDSECENLTIVVQRNCMMISWMILMCFIQTLVQSVVNAEWI